MIDPSSINWKKKKTNFIEKFIERRKSIFAYILSALSMCACMLHPEELKIDAPPLITPVN